MIEMDISIINKKSLERTNRLDSEYYRSSFKFLNKKLNEKGAISLTKLVDVSDGNHLKISEYFQNEGIPYFRGKDINSDFFIENSNPENIPQEVYEKSFLKRSYFKPGDVILSIVGTVGSLSLIPENIKKSTGSCKLAILRSNGIEPEYIASFLLCKYGQSQIIQNTRGAVQTGLLLEDMDQILIYTSDDGFRKIIQKIILKAILNNRLSKNFYKDAEDKLLSELGLTNWNFVFKQSFEKKFIDIQKSQRIDAEYFQPMYDEFEEKVESFKGGWKKIGNIVTIKKGIEPGSNLYKDIGVPFVRVSNLSKFGFNSDNQQYISPELYKTISNHQPHKDEILLTKDATPGIAYYIMEEPKKIIISSGIIRLKIKQNQHVKPEYLTLLINSIICQKQIEKYSGGSIIDHWLIDQVKDTYIPILSLDKQEVISELVHVSFEKLQISRDLLEIAKSGIEKAIEEGEEISTIWIAEQIKRIGIDL